MYKIQSVKDLSISKRIFIYMILVIAIYMILSSALISAFSRNLIRNYTNDYIKSRQQQINSGVSHLIQEVIISSLRITTHSGLYEVMLSDEKNYEVKKEEIQKIIRELDLDDRKIGQITLIDAKGIQYEYNFVNKPIQPISTEHTTSIEKSKRGIWGDIVKDTEGTSYLTYMVPLYNYYTMQNGGSMIIYMSEEAINNVYRNLVDDMGEMFIIDENNRIISHNNDQIIGNIMIMPKLQSDTTNQFTYQINEKENQKAMISRLKNEELSTALGLELYLVNILNYDKLFDVVQEVNKGLIVIMGIIAIVIAIGVFWVCRTLSKQLHRLAGKIKEFGKGNMAIEPYRNETKDNEIYILEQNFNRMVEEIKNLIDKNNYEKEQQRKMELVALQAQINPHFLYNTLDTISWIAKMRNQVEIEDIVIQLATFFRLSLNSGKKYVTVEQEILIVQSFARIEQIRAPNRFEIIYEIDEHIKEYEIIKLILQPIVENAIKHGMNRRKKNGHILLRATVQDHLLEFIVEDDGVGFDPKEALIRKKESHLRPSGYGIKNVKERLRLEYGERCQLDIKSQMGVGTTVKLTIELNT